MGDKFSISRRRLLQAGAALGGAMLLPGLMQAAWAAGSDKPEQTTVRVGFIPLTDCAPLAIASLKGFDKSTVLPSCRQRGQLGGGARYKLVAGELDAAHEKRRNLGLPRSHGRLANRLNTKSID